MKKSLYLLASIALAVSLFASSTIIINDVEWAPFFMQTKDKGFAKELIEAYLAYKKLPYAYQLLPPTRTEEYMKTGKIDFCVYSYRSDREIFLSYSKEPLFDTSYRIFLRKDSSLNPQCLESLQTMKTGRIQGIAYTDEITTFFVQQEKAGFVETVKDLKTLLMMLDSGRIDAIIEVEASAGWQSKLMGISDRIKACGPALARKPYFLTISKLSPYFGKTAAAFLDEFDIWLKQYKKSPDYEQLQKKYGLVL